MAEMAQMAALLKYNKKYQQQIPHNCKNKENILETAKTQLLDESQMEEKTTGCWNVLERKLRKVPK